jgi:hypothetical protein
MMDQRPIRALVITVIVTVLYNVLAMVADQAHAPLLAELLASLSHARGFTLGVACGCVATGEPLLLAVFLAAVFLLGPVDVIHVCFAVVAGGGLGALFKSFTRGHRHDVKPVPRPDAR